MGLLARLGARFRRPPAAPTEDPRVALDRAYAEQLALLQQSRRGLADVATARVRIDRQAQELERQAGALQDQAEQAVAAGHDALALTALERQGSIAEQRSELLRRHRELGAQEDGLRQAVGTLADRIEHLRTQMETLAAQHAAADAQATISGALGDVTAQVTTADALQAVEDSTLARRAEAAALEELAGPPLGTAPDVSPQQGVAQLRAQQEARRSQPADSTERPGTGTTPQ